MADSIPNSDEIVRSSIATQIIKYGTIVLGFVALTIVVTGLVIAYHNTDTKDGMNLVTDVFHSLLPVIAAWIGAVIAFYFGKENFESASKQINNLVNKITPDQFKAVPAKQIMVDFATMVKYPNADASTLKFSDLDGYFKDDSSKSRLPVVDKDCYPLFIIHKDEYAKLTIDLTNKDKLIKDFNEYGYNQSKGFVIISENASLSDAQDAIKKISACEDVFVTKNGTEKEALMGWLTNDRILNFLQ